MSERILDKFYKEIKYKPDNNFANVYEIKPNYRKEKRYVQLTIKSKNFIETKSLKFFLDKLNRNFKMPYSINIQYDSFQYDLQKIKEYWVFLSIWLPKLFSDVRDIDINNFELSEDNVLKIYSSNKKSYDYLILNKNKFNEYFLRFGFKRLKFVITLNEKKILSQDIKKFKSEIIESKNKNLPSDLNKYKFVELNEIEGKENKKVSVKGNVINSRKIKSKNNSYIYQFTLSSSTGSLNLKSKWLGEESENFDSVKEGDLLEVWGTIKYDSYLKKLILEIYYLQSINKDDLVEKDTEEIKRIEFHAHTKMSTMDSIVSGKELVNRAALLGHKAITITDHNSVQSFPEIMWQSKSKNIKINYGLELDVVDFDNSWVVKNASNQSTYKGTFVFFDLETTGLNPVHSQIIEIGAVKYHDTDKIETFQIFIKNDKPLSEFTKNLTGITDEMLSKGLEEKEALENFKEFIKGSKLVAHNAEFDFSFLNYHFIKNDLGKLDNPVIDTLKLSQNYIKSFSYRLGQVARKLGIDFDEVNAHRADYDADKLADVYYTMEPKFRNDGYKDLNSLNQNILQNIKDNLYTSHLNIIAKNENGLKDLYGIVSEANTTYLTKKGIKFPFNEIFKNRENILVGSGCENGFVWKAANSNPEDLSQIISILDYVEIQPPSSYSHLIEKGNLTREEVTKTIKLIIDESLKQNKIIIATGDVHFLDKEDYLPRKIIVNSKSVGGRRHPLFNYRGKTIIPNQTFRSTNKMLKEFEFLGESLSREIVITNTIKLNNLIKDIKPLKEELYKPKFKEAESIIFNYAEKKLKKIYGQNPDDKVIERYRIEKSAIKNNDFDVFYYLAHVIVKKSLSDNYLVGSRGSVGSSFLAFLTDISEVNPLPAHYICPKCHNTIWSNKHSMGLDLEETNCEKCGERMNKDGYSIPFETFLGFTGNKVPDIDLNFSGVYQSQIHKFTKNLFKEGQVFRAGTISTVAKKTAYGYVKAYFEENSDYNFYSNDVLFYLSSKIEGVKRTTGSHPGGLIIVPDKYQLEDFTPSNYPGDDKTSEMKTTHFEYQAIHDNLLKLDLLGHDDPTVLRELFDKTHKDPRDINLEDKNILKLFQGLDAFEIDKKLVDIKTGLLGIPEFGTDFARGLVKEAEPKSFADLVRISGLSHGTFVWTNNAKDIVSKGIAKLKEVISCRDDIMNYLISKDIEKPLAFKIMELVRKGKKVSEEDNALLRTKNVPEWYIESMKKIQYLFPKAHASAYVIMALRISWYKIYYPLAFYATYFKVRVDSFDLESMLTSIEAVKAKIMSIDNLIKNKIATTKDLEIKKSLQVANEMIARGYKFEKMDLEKVDSSDWLINEKNKTLMPPLIAIEGLGLSTADLIIKARNHKKFRSIEDLKIRGKVGKATLTLIEKYGLTENLEDSETKQISIF